MWYVSIHMSRSKILHSPPNLLPQRLHLFYFPSKCQCILKITQEIILESLLILLYFHCHSNHVAPTSKYVHNLTSYSTSLNHQCPSHQNLWTKLCPRWRWSSKGRDTSFIRELDPGNCRFQPTSLVLGNLVPPTIPIAGAISRVQLWEM